MFNQNTLTVRVIFKGSEAEKLTQLSNAYGYTKHQDLIKMLVLREEEKRLLDLRRYGGGPGEPRTQPKHAPRETKAERRSRIENMADGDLLSYLQSIGELGTEWYSEDNGRDYSIGVSDKGERRVILYNLKRTSTGVNRTEAGYGEEVATLLNRLERAGKLTVGAAVVDNHTLA